MELTYLVERLVARGHCEAAAYWAVIRLIERQFLGGIAVPNQQVICWDNLASPQVREIIPHPVVIVNGKRIDPPGTVCTTHLECAEEELDETEIAIDYPPFHVGIWSMPALWDWWGRTPKAVLTLPPLPEPDSPRVVLNGPGRAPVVLNNPKGPLTMTRYDVVKALLDAGPGGLTKDDLVKKSGHTDAVNILKALAKSDPDWQQVIHLPGKPGRRYRVY